MKFKIADLPRTLIKLQQRTVAIYEKLFQSDKLRVKELEAEIHYLKSQKQPQKVE